MRKGAARMLLAGQEIWLFESRFAGIPLLFSEPGKTTEAVKATVLEIRQENNYYHLSTTLGEARISVLHTIKFA